LAFNISSDSLLNNVLTINGRLAIILES
jgi:hypothetical protein